MEELMSLEGLRSMGRVQLPHERNRERERWTAPACYGGAHCKWSTAKWNGFFFFNNYACSFCMPFYQLLEYISVDLYWSEFLNQCIPLHFKPLLVL